MRLYTDAIDSQGYFDPRYTCDIDNSSPELRWDEFPEATKGFALIAEDSDASQSVFAHWVVYNIPRAVQHLPAGIPPQDGFSNGIRQGLNDWGKLGYAGPCPPRGDRPHNYVIRIYALSELPDLGSRIRRSHLIEKIQSLILASAEIRGRYSRMIEKAG